MKVFDEVLNKEVKVHEFVSGDVGIEIKLNDPESFEKIFKENMSDDEEE